MSCSFTQNAVYTVWILEIKQTKTKKKECIVLRLSLDTTTNTCWIYDDALIDNNRVVLSWIGVLNPAASRIWPNFMVHDVSLENEIRDKHQNEHHNHTIHFKLRHTAYFAFWDDFSSRAFIIFINWANFSLLYIESLQWYDFL